MKKYLRKKGIWQLIVQEKGGTKIELHSLGNDSKAQLERMVYGLQNKNNMQMLYLRKGTENRHITTAKWSIEHKDGERIEY